MKPFSVLVPSWNNLPFLRLCIDSLRRNSATEHQIIVHVNDGSDGTLEWVKAQGLDYTHSEKNVGVCLAMNMMRTKVKTDYMCFVNDDMYALPGWDTALWKEISHLPDNRFFLSSTTIQRHVNEGETLIRGDYGSSPENFREADLLRDYMWYDLPDWAGATMPANIVHRDIWDLVGVFRRAITRNVFRPRLHRQALALRHPLYERSLGLTLLPLRDTLHHPHSEEPRTGSIFAQMGPHLLHLPTALHTARPAIRRNLRHTRRHLRQAQSTDSTRTAQIHLTATHQTLRARPHAVGIALITTTL